MIEQSLVTLLLVVVTCVITYKGFNNSLFQESYAFDVDRIMIRKDYIRLISSGFLHTGWTHLVFNMIALYLFGSSLEPFIGGIKILVIYFASLVGGNLLALFIHKNHGNYTSVGASGAVNGIVFSSIALFPDGGIGLLLIPVSIPAWAFGLVYVLFSIYGIKAKWGNSGHGAHLGGALTGMLITIAFYPDVLSVNTLPILLIVLPTMGFIFFVINKPEFLVIDSFSKEKERRSVDHEYNYRKAREQESIDAILEKIHKKGMSSLTKQEKEALENYSRMRR